MSEDQTTLQIELEFQAEGCTAKDGTCSNLFESYSISREAGENPIGTINGYTVSENIILDSMLTEENLKRYRELQGYPDGEWSENIQPVRYLLWTFDNEEQWTIEAMQKRMGDCSFLKLKMLKNTDEVPKKVRKWSNQFDKTKLQM